MQMMHRAPTVGRAAVSRRSFGPAKSQRRPQAIVASAAGDLKAKFGIPGSVDVVEGRGGLTTVVLKHSSGASAEVILFGGLVSSWKQSSGDEVLYVRPDAVFDRSKPISGGIPHCFPQFGPSTLMQQHGFARNLDWTLAASSANPQPDEVDPEIELHLTPNEYTMKMWPFKFQCVYTVRLHGEELHTELRVINTDDKPFDFTAALHSYFEVKHVSEARVTGLKGLKFLDKSIDPSNPIERTETRDAITFEAYTDYVYGNAPSHVELEVGTGAAVTIDASGWEDVVVWNPWHTMQACYESFVCVENAKFSSPVVLQPGASWTANSNFAVVDLK